VRVNAVLIGLIESGQHRRTAANAGISEADLYAEQGKSIPLGRVGTGAEFADLVTYLLSDRSSFVTGSAINLDGGASPVL
jgi:NAD(P)-dependent dehydrogenase (short-subunit alcohol dehydrogenase family)